MRACVTAVEYVADVSRSGPVVKVATIVLSSDLSSTVITDELTIDDDASAVEGEGMTSPPPAADLVRSGRISAAEGESHISKSEEGCLRLT